jgi:threonine/homoserine/homoserine lactone efflux protein
MTKASGGPIKRPISATEGLAQVIGPLLNGLLIGFSIAAPVGPIGLLCTRRSLAEGQLAGLLTGLGAQAGFGAAAAMVAGVFLGSALWWLLLSGITGRLRTRVKPAWMVWINRASGTLLSAFGIIALARAASPIFQALTSP